MMMIKSSVSENSENKECDISNGEDKLKSSFNDYPPIEESVSLEDKLECVALRYCTPRYWKDPSKVIDVCALVHHNRVIIVTTVPLQCPDIKSIEFQVSKNQNRLENRAFGKCKRGAQHIRVGDVLCIATLYSGSIHPIPSPVTGKLVEVNERLVSNPELCSKDPWNEGYIAIILPPLPKDTSQRDNSLPLLSQEEYESSSSKEKPSIEST